MLRDKKIFSEEVKAHSATFSLIYLLRVKDTTIFETLKMIFISFFHFKSSFRSQENQNLEF